MRPWLSWYCVLQKKKTSLLCSIFFDKVATGTKNWNKQKSTISPPSCDLKIQIPNNETHLWILIWIPRTHCTRTLVVSPAGGLLIGRDACRRTKGTPALTFAPWGGSQRGNNMAAPRHQTHIRREGTACQHINKKMLHIKTWCASGCLGERLCIPGICEGFCLPICSSVSVWERGRYSHKDAVRLSCS